jgi:hypothetical protein
LAIQSFRENQKTIIDTLLAGRDVFALMPTGSGKSLCFQIPAIIRPGVGVVVSPLIALMQDQVTDLHQVGVRAHFLNSSLPPTEAARVEAIAAGGQCDLLYVAPERLLTDRFQRLLAQMNLALFAIDEAHCVSQWGHDFRPEYLQIAEVTQRFPQGAANCPDGHRRSGDATGYCRKAPVWPMLSGLLPASTAPTFFTGSRSSRTTNGNCSPSCGNDTAGMRASSMSARANGSMPLPAGSSKKALPRCHTMPGWMPMFADAISSGF